MAGFGSKIAAMDAAIMGALSDGHGQFVPADGRRPVDCVELIVDRNLQQQGAGGVVLTNAVGITCSKAVVGNVDRGDLFIFKGSRFVVEVPLSDDGHMMTLVCMVQP